MKQKYQFYLNFIGNKMFCWPILYQYVFCAKLYLQNEGSRFRDFTPSFHLLTLDVFSVHLLLLLNLPTCVCQRAFFDDKIWIDYKRMPSCEVYIKKKRREIWEVQTQEKHRAEENEKLEIDLNPLISVTFLPQLKASPKSAPFQFHTPSKLLSCEGGAPHVCI